MKDGSYWSFMSFINNTRFTTFVFLYDTSLHPQPPG